MSNLGKSWSNCLVRAHLRARLRVCGALGCGHGVRGFGGELSDPEGGNRDECCYLLAVRRHDTRAAVTGLPEGLSALTALPS